MLEDVLENISPNRNEKNKLEETASRICSLVEEKSKELDVGARPRLVGSSARGTWISGDRDIDVFILFSKNLNRNGLEKKGLKIAREVGREGDEFVEDFAEHPYITAVFDEFLVDLVPAYDVEEPEEVSSAVDRTPLHDRYISSKLNDELKKGVRLLKKFMKTIGVYGAELKTKGFSGYLTELLVLNQKNKEKTGINYFNDVLKEACTWKKGKIIDLENYGTGKKFNAPLVVVDPVDPNRNVAAALELEQWARFIGAAQSFLENPRKELFKEQKIKKMELNSVKETFNERKTNLVGIKFNKLDLVEDTLYPQLYKTKKWLKSVLEENNFEVIRSDVYVTEDEYLVFLEIKNKLPRVEKHAGPPVIAEKHSKKFIKKYRNNNLFSGPYIEEDKWVVERKRKNTSPSALIKEKLFDSEQCGIGKDLKKTEKEVIKGKELFKEEYLDFFSRYLNKKEVWI